MVNTPRLFQVMLAYGTHERRLRTLVTDLLGEAHFLADAQFVELARLYAIAVEVNLPAVSRCDESVITIGVQGRNNAVGWHVVSLDLALLFAHEVLQLAARGLERITDCHVGVLVGAGYVGIAVDDDVGGVRYGEVDADPVGVSLVMAMLGTPDDDAR